MIDPNLYGVPNHFAMLLQLLRMSDADELIPVLDPLSDALRAVEKRIDGYGGSKNLDVQLLIDDDCGFVEDLLGAAFVVAQRFITGMHSRYSRLYVAVEHKSPGQWQLPKPKRKDDFLQKFGPRCPSHVDVSAATALNASANYFKHSSEWAYPWSQNTGNSERTIEIVTRLGASEGSTGNCRTLATAIGIGDYKNLDPIVTAMNDWRHDLRSQVEQELTRIGLV